MELGDPKEMRNLKTEVLPNKRYLKRLRAELLLSRFLDQTCPAVSSRYQLSSTARYGSLFAVIIPSWA